MPNLAASEAVFDAAAKSSRNTTRAAVFHVLRLLHHIVAVGVLATSCSARLVNSPVHWVQVPAWPAEAKAGEAIPGRL